VNPYEARLYRIRVHHSSTPRKRRRRPCATTPNAISLPHRDRPSHSAFATGRATDAYLAALAIETGAELFSADRDFARFPGLRWRRP